MKTTRLTVAAMALLSGISVAAAADMSQSGGKTSATTGSGTAQEKMAKPPAMAQAKESPSLTAQQQKMAWKDISKHAIKVKAPADFTAMVGAALPAGHAHPVPVSTSNKVPALRPYQYALLDSKKLLIVNPSDKKVADVITQ